MQARLRQMTPSEKLRVYELKREGKTYDAIADTLYEESDDGRRFDRATIYRVYSNMPQSDQDEPFEWHRMEEYGLPWEAGAFLMDMWRFLMTLDLDLWEEHAIKGEEVRLPTAREMRWCWRLYLAAPTLPMESLWRIGNFFSVQELIQEILKEPQSLSGQEAYIAFKPWLDDQHKEKYDRAVTLGMIPSPRLSIDETLERGTTTFVTFNRKIPEGEKE